MIKLKHYELYNLTSIYGGYPTTIKEVDDLEKYYIAHDPFEEYNTVITDNGVKYLYDGVGITMRGDYFKMDTRGCRMLGTNNKRLLADI